MSATLKGGAVREQEFTVRGIPTNFLLDADGKIIAKNLRGIALHRELDKLVKSL